MSPSPNQPSDSFQAVINHALAMAVVGLLMSGLTIIANQLQLLQQNAASDTLTGLGIGLATAGISGLAVYVATHRDQLSLAVETALYAADRAEAHDNAAAGSANLASESAAKADLIRQNVRALADSLNNPPTPQPPAEAAPSTQTPAPQAGTTTQTMPATSSPASDSPQPAAA